MPDGLPSVFPYLGSEQIRARGLPRRNGTGRGLSGRFDPTSNSAVCVSAFCPHWYCAATLCFGEELWGSMPRSKTRECLRAFPTYENKAAPLLHWLGDTHRLPHSPGNGVCGGSWRDWRGDGAQRDREWHHGIRGRGRNPWSHRRRRRHGRCPWQSRNVRPGRS